ncbi:hypothetical protein C7S16_3273 [Burkholderia thailandensis]|uniref:Uncharacterized protein n=1 Tax=Burkholderia thailandensis TaxID=57975 RepID=A0AAW9D3F9_BURTH|nr:hypothetical protein [Burkholderia thailandensis]MDW9255371.1 hypothetical protein [Burkholderia thailandensis]
MGPPCAAGTTGCLQAYMLPYSVSALRNVAAVHRGASRDARPAIESRLHARA